MKFFKFFEHIFEKLFDSTSYAVDGVVTELK